jgi:HlyD family secretion protein
MTTGRKVLIGLVLIAIIATAATLSIRNAGDRGIEVRIEAIEARDLTETVTASGNVRAGRIVDISSDVSARVSELLIEEGDDVEAGQLMLRLDPTQFDAVVNRAAAALNQARAQSAQQEASLVQARRDRDRLENLFARDSLLVARQQLEDARTNFERAVRQLESSEFGVAQAVASVDEAQERLSKTIFRAPISGKVTRLNVELGETVIVGTMNNPGSLVLTISELSRVEAVVQVDETDVPYISLGDDAILELDAFPGQRLQGTVTEIGNSAITPPSQNASQATAIDFEVVITMENPPGGLRPDLSVTADIITAKAEGAISVPIIALTVRAADGSGASPTEEATDEPERQLGPSAVHPEDEDVEGVFVVSDGKAEFVQVEVGITGQDHFEVLSGVQIGDSIVVGPYQRIRDLRSGSEVKAPAEDKNTGN